MEKWKKKSEVESESASNVEETDAMGREKFWEDIGRP